MCASYVVVEDEGEKIPHRMRMIVVVLSIKSFSYRK